MLILFLSRHTVSSVIVIFLSLYCWHVYFLFLFDYLHGEIKDLYRRWLCSETKCNLRRKPVTIRHCVAFSLAISDIISELKLHLVLTIPAVVIGCVYNDISLL